MSSDVILFPDFEKLKAEVDKLRTELSMLIYERDELVLVECKNLEMEYMLALGDLEYKAYELHCTVLRLKRKTELIQARKNRQEKIILSDIEAALDEEFADYQARLEEQIGMMNDAIEREKCPTLSEKDSRELKKLYHAVVKALHPDLNPGIGPEKLTLFHNAVRAYENGDLKGLRLISAMVCEPEAVMQTEDGLSELKQERERLCGLIAGLREEIAKIKSEYPYTVKELVGSRDKIAEKRAELTELIEQLREVAAAYEKTLKEMLR